MDEYNAMHYYRLLVTTGCCTMVGKVRRENSRIQSEKRERE